MLVSLIFLDMLVDIVFFRNWLSDSVLFVLVMMIALAVGFFVFPPVHVALDPDGIRVAYPLGRRRRLAYSSIKEYRIDDMLLLVELALADGKEIEFYYSVDELEAIRAVLDRNGVPPAKEGAGPGP